MELSILIARILSVTYLSAALGGFCSAGYYRKLSDELYENVVLTYMMGFFAVIVGMILVHFHGRWAKDWTILITIMGWAVLIKGILIIIFPELLRRMSKPFLTEKSLKLFPYAALLAGLLFGYFGFVSGGS